MKNTLRVAFSVSTLSLLALAPLACDEAGLTDPAATRCDPEIARADRDTDEDLTRCFGGRFGLEDNRLGID